MSNSIIISNKSFDDNDWNSLSSNLIENNNINSLYFSGVLFSKNDFKHLDAIIQNYTNIKEIKIEWCELNNYIIDFDNLCDSIIKSHINMIYLNNNKINHNGVNSIIKMLKYGDNIHYLDLRWNELNDDCAKLIYEALIKNTSIQYLNIVGNKILNNQLLDQINSILLRNKFFFENSIKTSNALIEKPSINCNFYYYF